LTGSSPSRRGAAKTAGRRSLALDEPAKQRLIVVVVVVVDATTARLDWKQ
jgi:hypothetical protein